MPLRRVALPLVLAALACESRDWNPPITDSAALAGEWRDGGATLRLDAGGGYQCTGGRACDPLGPRGTWARSGDFFLRLAPERGQAVEWRISATGLYYQLAAGETRGDPDAWSPRLTFRLRRRAA